MPFVIQNFETKLFRAEQSWVPGLDSAKRYSSVEAAAFAARELGIKAAEVIMFSQETSRVLAGFLIKNEAVAAPVTVRTK